MTAQCACAAITALTRRGRGLAERLACVTLLGSLPLLHLLGFSWTHKKRVAETALHAIPPAVAAGRAGWTFGAGGSGAAAAAERIALHAPGVGAHSTAG